MFSNNKEILWAATHSGVQTAAAGNNTQYHDRMIVLAPNIVVFFFDQCENTIFGSCNRLRWYQPTSCGCQGSVFFGMDYRSRNRWATTCVGLVTCFFFFFCKDGSHRLMKRASSSCYIFLCVVFAATNWKYRSNTFCFFFSFLTSRVWSNKVVLQVTAHQAKKYQLTSTRRGAKCVGPITKQFHMETPFC